MILTLINYAIHLREGEELQLVLSTKPKPMLKIEFPLARGWEHLHQEEAESLEFVQRLARRIPARLEQRFSVAAARQQVQLTLHFETSPSRTILIIDDQMTAQKMYQRYLSKSGLAVIGVIDPKEALAIAHQVSPAAIILDIMMPHLDGWELLQSLQLNAQTRHIPVLICSAWGDSNLAYSLGAAAFIKKPVFQKDLLAALVRLGLIPQE